MAEELTQEIDYLKKVKKRNRVYAGIYCEPETLLNKSQTKEIQLDSEFDEPFECVEKLVD